MKATGEISSYSPCATACSAKTVEESIFSRISGIGIILERHHASIDPPIIIPACEFQCARVKNMAHYECGLSAYALNK